MARILRALAAASLLVVAGACNNFLTGDKLDSDPNRATSAQAAQLFVASQVNSYYILTGHAARVLAMWSQQMAGTDRQYIGYDQYSVTEGLFGEFTSVYTGGGLIDHRSIQADALANGNRTLVGIDKVWEALVVSFAADNYGDVPYSEAAGTVQQPKLDPQLSVYAALQTLLDGAIADLQANQGVVGSLDLSFNGNNALWIRVARTLKARLYMHTAEVSTGAYALALAQAQQGISAPSGDLKSRHRGPSGTGEENIWWQFIARDRDSYIRPGKFLVDLMLSRNDPRVPLYFARNDRGTFGGAAPAQGLDPNLHSNLSATRLVPDFPQPIVTWAETQGIIAEAAYRTGNFALAQSATDAIRADAGLPAIASSLSGPALLKQALEEKYIALFQNPEVFQDYKRTCYPNITPASASAAAGIPARFTYPVAERSANPDNIPDVGAQPRRNANDPANATSVDGTPCLGQK